MPSLQYSVLPLLDMSDKKSPPRKVLCNLTLIYQKTRYCAIIRLCLLLLYKCIRIYKTPGLPSHGLVPSQIEKHFDEESNDNLDWNGKEIIFKMF